MDTFQPIITYNYLSLGSLKACSLVRIYSNNQHLAIEIVGGKCIWISSLGESCVLKNLWTYGTDPAGKRMGHLWKANDNDERHQNLLLGQRKTY